VGESGGLDEGGAAEAVTDLPACEGGGEGNVSQWWVEREREDIIRRVSV
jgi:hypothetical protein